MILINLLPHREEKRKRRKAAFFAGLILSALVGVAVVLMAMLLIQHMRSEQEMRNRRLSNEIQRLDTQIKDIADLKAEIEGLKSRQKAVEDLQADRNAPVHLLNELARQTPEGVYLTAVKQSEKDVMITGVAQTQDRISEFLRNTGKGSDWFFNPELLESKLSTVSNARDQKRLFEFSVRVSLKAPERELPAKPGQPKKS